MYIRRFSECNELNSKVPKILDEKGMEEKARELLHRVGRDIDPKKLVKDLTVSEQQMVEIAKILARNAWLIILDEPTSSLTEIEKEYLFKTMRSLKEEGVSMIYISHRMQETFEICRRDHCSERWTVCKHRSNFRRFMNRD